MRPHRLLYGQLGAPVGWVASRELPLLLDMRVTRLVVDELEIVYCDVKRVRRFTSAGWLKGRGKRVTHTQPYQYETLNLAPIRMWSMGKVGRFVQRRIEGRNTTNEMTPPCEYLGTDREYLCNYCPVRDLCTRMNEGNDSAA